MDTPMLALCAGLPAVAFAAGEAVVREGDAGGTVWVLESGRLQVLKAGVAVNVVERPGALVGEVSLLLDRPYGATVLALEASVLRRADDGRALLASHPDIAWHVARGLAERLNFVTAYLADLKRQYADAPGLAMVGDVLQQLAQAAPAPLTPGSRREPEPLD